MQISSTPPDPQGNTPGVRFARSWSAAPGANARSLFMSLAAQDWLLLLYLSVQFLACARGAGPYREAALERLAADFLILCIGITMQRGGFVSGWLGALAYRLGVFCALFGSFLQLDLILPTANAHLVDAKIYGFDLAVFHVEPAVAWDRFVNATTTEWFSFFYYSYFFLLAAHVLPMLFAERRKEILQEFALGILTLYAVAHTLYMVVPAYGPWVHFKGQFAHDLNGSFWWPLVRKTVDSVGARTDVFPSLHTGGPTFLALFSWRNRHKLPFKYTWPIVAFFATQIIIATMFLRWHYLIDIVVGFSLATACAFGTARIAKWERDRRARLDIPPVWTELKAR